MAAMTIAPVASMPAYLRKAMLEIGYTEAEIDTVLKPIVDPSPHADPSHVHFHSHIGRFHGRTGETHVHRHVHDGSPGQHHPHSTLHEGG